MGSAEERRYRAEDLLKLRDERLHELVNGQLVEKQRGAYNAGVAGEILWRLWKYSDRRLGWPFGVTGYQCFPDDPEKVRLPDCSFVRFGRLPGGRLPKGFLQVHPDLAIEVVGHQDRYSEVMGRVLDYLRVGVPLIWLVEPESKMVHVIHPDGTGVRLTEEDELSGEDVLPGFRCPIRELFPPREEPSEPEVQP